MRGHCKVSSGQTLSRPSIGIGDTSQLVAEVHPRIEASVTRCLHGDLASADDVLQESLLVLWRVLPRVRCGDHFIRLAYVIAKQRALDHLRRDSARRRNTGVCNSEALEGVGVLDVVRTERAVLSVTARSQQQGRLVELARSTLTADEFKRARFFSPEEAFEYFASQRRRGAASTVKGYRVTVRQAELSAQERKARMEAIARVLRHDQSPGL